MKSPLLSLLFGLTVSQASAVVLFTESFETYTPGNIPSPTWTVYNQAQTHVVTGEASEGSQSLWFNDGAAKFHYLRQNNALAIPAGGDLVISFDIKATSASQSPDGLSSFQIDFGSGIQTVLVDLGAFDGYDGSYSGSTITLPNTPSTSGSSFISYSITIPETYFGTSGLNATEMTMRWNTVSSSGYEEFYLDNIVVSSVPEPSSAAAVLALAATGLLFLRRRK
tara:strand:+ start:124 stop:795 length:672 start_codon:yes stop_codon:yes gene_type:complete